MPVGALFEGEGFSREDYDAVSAHIGQEPMEGALLHIAGPTDSGWRVIEVWDSEDAQRRFQESRLDAAFEQAGKQPIAPAFFPVHALLPPPEVLRGPTGG
jgi:hypothetical protein